MVEKTRYERDEYFDFGRRHGAYQALNSEAMREIALRLRLTEAAYIALCAVVERQERALMLERERMRFYSARRCWSVRGERTPKNQETWGEWFERMYGESLEDYAKRAAGEGITKKVYEYEIATFGHSPLEPEMQRRMS